MSYRMSMWLLSLSVLILVGCSAQQEPSSDAAAPATSTLVVKYETPAPMDVPARVEPASDTDWKAIVNNKNVEIIEVVNILTPVAVYLTAAFEQYGDKFGEFTQEEWVDTQAQLTAASTKWEECKQRMADSTYDRQLFLDLEEAWQIFVKVGVAGLRTKTMVEADLARAS